MVSSISKRARPSIVGDYEVHTDREPLGEGAYAKVYVAHDPMGRRVAAKCMDLSKIKLSTVEREQRILESLNAADCPYVIQLLNAEEVDGNFYLMLELCEGGELFDRVIDAGQLPESLAKRYFKQLMACIAGMHSHGIANRDVKLENCLITSTGDIRVTDFGLALDRLPPHPPLRTDYAGSKSYTAPELNAGTGHCPFQADLWAAAVTLWCSVCGFFPFDNAEPSDWRFQKLQQAEAAGASFTRAILAHYCRPCLLSEPLVRLLDAMLHTDPSRRLTLDEVLASEWLTEAEPTPPAPTCTGHDPYVQDPYVYHGHDQEDVFYERCPYTPTDISTIQDSSHEDDNQPTFRAALLPQAGTMLYSNDQLWYDQCSTQLDQAAQLDPNWGTQSLSAVDLDHALQAVSGLHISKDSAKKCAYLVKNGEDSSMPMLRRQPGRSHNCD